MRCSAHTAAVASCERRAGLTRTSCSFKNESDTYRRTKKTRNSVASKTPPLEKHFFSSKNPMYLLAASINTKGDISGMPSMQLTEQISTSPAGLRVSEHMPRRPSCVCLLECSFSRANLAGAPEARKTLVEVALTLSLIHI